MRTTILTTIAAAACAVMLAPASQARDIEQHRTVSYADLDLASRNDALELHGRIMAAAKDACGGNERGATNLAVRTHVRRCTRKAVNDAIARIDQPAVTLAHLDTVSWAVDPSVWNAPKPRRFAFGFRRNRG